MQAKRAFTVQSFFAILIVNAALLAVIYAMTRGAELTLTQLGVFLGAGLAATIITWAIVRAMGNKLAAELEAEVRNAAAPSVPASTAVAEAPAAAAPPPVDDEACMESGAVQMLAILQRDGRLIDFLQEDLTPFQDAQIGAAVRSVHAGCKLALDEHLTLENVFADAEGSRVTVEPGFDAYAIRLSGNVSGEPPFTGTLQHRGWRAASISLPKRVEAKDDSHIIAAAQVEVV